MESQKTFLQLIRFPVDFPNDKRFFRLNKNNYGQFTGIVRGIGSFSRKAVRIVVDFDKKSISFLTSSNVQKRVGNFLNSNASSTIFGKRNSDIDSATSDLNSFSENNNMTNILRLLQEDIQYRSLKVEKSNEDNRMISIVNYFDKVQSAERTCDVILSNIHEREFLYYAIHSLMESQQQAQLNLFIGSFNLGGAAPNSLEGWIPTSRSPSHFPIDLYVVGVQEFGEVDWLRLTENWIGEEYEIVCEVHMWGIGLVVLAHKKHRKHLTNIESSTMAAGFANVLGNKGGVGISLSYCGTSLCFVNCHLPARAERVLNRNEVVRGLMEGLNLGLKKHDLVHNKFHHLFWFGDLNYRINFLRPKILLLLEHQQYDALIRGDQLTKEMEGHRVLSNFQEGKITFPPTYRYDRGCNEWSKKKLRNVPSYCDRILWKSLPGLQVNQLEYGIAQNITTSDHRPVYSLFRVPVQISNNRNMSFSKDLFPVGQLLLYDFEISEVYPHNFPQRKSSSSPQTPSVLPKIIDYFNIRSVLTNSAKQVQIVQIGVGHWKMQEEVELIGPFQIFKGCFIDEYLIVQLFIIDRDTYSGSNAMIGSCVIPIKACFFEKKRLIEFQVPVSYCGLQWGFLSGVIDVVWLKPYPEEIT